VLEIAREEISIVRANSLTWIFQGFSKEARPRKILILPQGER